MIQRNILEAKSNPVENRDLSLIDKDEFFSVYFSVLLKHLKQNFLISLYHLEVFCCSNRGKYFCNPLYLRVYGVYIVLTPVLFYFLRYLINPERTLQLHYVKVEDAGKYICTAVNHVGVVSAAAQLLVEGNVILKTTFSLATNDLTDLLIFSS